MFKCEKCNNEYKTRSAKSNHEKSCGISSRVRKPENRICPKCDMLIYSSYAAHIGSCDGFGPRRRTKREKRRSIPRGSTFDEIYGKEKSLEIRTKVSKKLIEKNKQGKSFHTEETRRKISRKIRENPNSGGLRKGSGRGKSGWYKGNWCDSTWELAWVIYNIENLIEFRRNYDGFEYSYKGKIFKYYPDFIIGNEYYEIKGRRNYESLDEKNKAKIDSFNNGVLNVLYSGEMKPYLDYVISRYGKDFHTLYE